jgi:hypothetical protein
LSRDPAVVRLHGETISHLSFRHPPNPPRLGTALSSVILGLDPRIQPPGVRTARRPFLRPTQESLAPQTRRCWIPVTSTGMTEERREPSKAGGDVFRTGAIFRSARTGAWRSASGAIIPGCRWPPIIGASSDGNRVREPASSTVLTVRFR